MADIHNYKKRLEKTLANIEKSKEISKKNKNLIVKFHDSCFSEGLGAAKVERYLYDLSRLAKEVKKDLSKATKDDLKGIVAGVEKREWSPHTKHTFKVMLKKFYRWVEGIDERGVYPDTVRWIRTGVKNGQTKLPEELITEEEIKLMISATTDLRDRALLSILAESGCRIGEIGGLRIKDVFFDEYGAKINVFGKTGSRRIRIVNFSPYLQEWINKHPTNHDSSSYLWVSQRGGKLLSYERLSAIIKKLGKKAGLTKRIYPHLFRHSRATFLAKNITEAQMKDYLGWAQSSKMAGVYVHMSGRDTDNAILGLSGIKVEEKEEIQKLSPRNCQRCQTVNEVTNKFCKLCGFVLDKDAADDVIKAELEKKKYDSLLNEVLEDEGVLEMIANKIKEKGLVVSK